MKKPIKNYTYLLSDLIASLLAWLIFYFIRRQILYGEFIANEAFQVGLFWISVVLIPLFWIALYTIAGTYQHNLYERSRLNEITQCFIWSMIGSLIVFFIFLIDDIQDSFHFAYYYKGFFTLFICQFVLVTFGRFVILARVRRHLQDGLYGFNILIAGNKKQASGALKDIEKVAAVKGWRVAGYVTEEAKPKMNGAALFHQYKHVGTISDIDNILAGHKIDKLVVALEPAEKDAANALVARAIEHDVDILLMPDMQDIVSGSVRNSDVMQGQFIVLDSDPMTNWQQNVKRLMDVAFAIIGCALLWPIMLYAAYRVSRSGTGGIIYRQERIGFKGKLFTIYKFRSMRADAEKDGPALSGDHDSRVTPWGRIMRKWRIDELPQLWNILKGDMSTVGPRPERPFFAEQIKKQNPYFKYLLRVKPGLTSLGMVQFGYASHVDEMLERMKYDLLYVENASIALDLKIMLFTLRIIFLGTGK